MSSTSTLTYRGVQEFLKVNCEWLGQKIAKLLVSNAYMLGFYIRFQDWIMDAQ